ncbi:hypothetical protein C8Q80DRAFT_212300 [Daedaleopsis nitida]|nr:hypothetical protein C8Q80DRAFT_212300 [Daedaleopsis nitida]
MASSSRPYTPPLPYKTSFASHRDHTAVAIRLAHTVTHPYLRPPHPTNVHSDVNPTTNSEPILSTLPLVYRPAPSFSHTRLIRLHATHNTRIPPSRCPRYIPPSRPTTKSLTLTSSECEHSPN